jgi:hypothetical protein
VRGHAREEIASKSGGLVELPSTLLLSQLGDEHNSAGEQEQ